MGQYSYFVNGNLTDGKHFSFFVKSSEKLALFFINNWGPKPDFQSYGVLMTDDPQYKVK